MVDRPILFSAPMVRALLEGRKTQTRRIVMSAEEISKGPWLKSRQHESGCWQVGLDRFNMWKTVPVAYAIGDRLWVREAHAIVGSVDPGYVLYRADGYETECERHGFDKPFPPESDARWRPSIHMPRWASRLTLEVVDVRVERLQDISEDDAIAEGCTQELADEIMGPDELALYGTTHILCPGSRGRILYETLWDQINGHGSWDKNPWVAACTFHVINRNIDHLTKTDTRHLEAIQ